MAERLDFDPDWLNDAAKAFMPGNDPDRIGVYEGDYLSVAAASPRFLLTMKLLAARVERDQDDIRLLYELCGFTTAEEGIDLVASAHPEGLIPPRARFLLEELFPRREMGRNKDRGLDRGAAPALAFELASVTVRPASHGQRIR